MPDFVWQARTLQGVAVRGTRSNINHKLLQAFLRGGTTEQLAWGPAPHARDAVFLNDVFNDSMYFGVVGEVSMVRRPARRVSRFRR